MSHLRRTISQNKELIEKYPWLHPHDSINHGSMWLDAEKNKLWDEHYDYSFTQLDDMPDGWNYTFGEQMCEEILQALKLDGIDPKNYHVEQVKEKYGSLRWYDSGRSPRIHKIVSKYEDLSEHICANCGMPATHMTRGWIGYYCKDCASKINEKAGRNYCVPIEVDIDDSEE